MKEKRGRKRSIKSFYIRGLLLTSIAILVICAGIYVVRNRYEIPVPIYSVSTLEEVKDILSNDAEIVYPDMSYFDIEGTEIVFAVCDENRRPSDGGGYEIEVIPTGNENAVHLDVTCLQKPIERYEEDKFSSEYTEYSGIKVMFYTQELSDGESKVYYLRYSFEMRDHWYYVSGECREGIESESSFQNKLWDIVMSIIDQKERNSYEK